MPFMILRKDGKRELYITLILFILSGLFLTTCEKLEYERVIKVETGIVANPTSNSVTIGGIIIDLGEGEIMQHGHCWSTTPNPTIEVESKTRLGIRKVRTTFVSNMTGLLPGTIYYIKAYATNTKGTAYGKEVNFALPEPINTAPSIHSSPRVSIAVDEAYTYTMVAEDPDIGDVLTYTAPIFPYWLSFAPETGTLKGTPSLADKGNHNVTMRASDGKVNVDQHFTISVFQPSGTVNDFQGNTYTTVKIGTRWWMAENLRSTQLNDGTDIPLETDALKWAQQTAPAYCWYDNSEVSYKNTYGALYNWFTVGTGKLCPTGWHVPSDAEWTALTDSLGGFTVAGGKLKETGTVHWADPNTGATNESGFTALPGGRRYFTTGGFLNILEYSYWWSGKEYTPGGPLAWSRYISNNTAKIEWGALEKPSGLSVRCIKD